MPGIEPGSERFDPRKSTSVVGRGSSSQGSRPTRTPCDQPLVFRASSGVVRGTPPLSRPIRHPVESGAGGRGLIYGDRLSWSRHTRRRGAWQRRKCGWHLIFCADFTSSAPLGSHSGTSLSRRSLSSPWTGLHPLNVGVPFVQNHYSILAMDFILPSGLLYARLLREFSRINHYG